MKRSLLTTIVLIAVTLGACGDDDDGVAADDGTSDQTTAPDETVQTSTPEETDDREAWCLGWNSMTPPDEDVDFQTFSESSLKSIDALAEVAPDEIATANETWAEKEQEIIDHIASYDWDLDAAPFLPEVTAERDAAISEVEAFAEDHC